MSDQPRAFPVMTIVVLAIPALHLTALKTSCQAWPVAPCCHEADKVPKWFGVFTPALHVAFSSKTSPSIRVVAVTHSQGSPTKTGLRIVWRQRIWLLKLLLKRHVVSALHTALCKEVVVDSELVEPESESGLREVGSIEGCAWALVEALSWEEVLQRCLLTVVNIRDYVKPLWLQALRLPPSLLVADIDDEGGGLEVILARDVHRGKERRRDEEI